MTKEQNSPVSAVAEPKRTRKVLYDLLLVGVVVLLALLALLLYKCTGKTGDFVVVLIDGRETARYRLQEDTEVLIETPDGGTNVLRIVGGTAMVVEANCPDGICADHPPISKTNETIVCLPHKLVVKVVSATEADAPDITV